MYCTFFKFVHIYIYISFLLFVEERNVFFLFFFFLLYIEYIEYKHIGGKKMKV